MPPPRKTTHYSIYALEYRNYGRKITMKDKRVSKKSEKESVKKQCCRYLNNDSTAQASNE
jgi:hypothetical protein